MKLLGGLGAAAFGLRAVRPVAATTFPPLTKSKGEWKKLLEPARYAVLFEEDTERAGSSPLDREKREGTYVCAACFLPLFDSKGKYDSGTGWPSFFQPLDPGHIGTKTDYWLLAPRTEYHCARCGGHQGHVFDDGPAPTYKRYCNNGLALVFVPRDEKLPELRSGGRELAKATFAGGCFWCMEPPFDAIDGVVSTTSGYTGGQKKNPTYEEVSAGGTGHAESIEVLFDPAKVSYEKLLDVFWHNVDPTALNRQFCDVGAQYRTAIFCHGDEQQRAAGESKRKLEESGALNGVAVVTEIVPANEFYPAEDYHQDYYVKNPLRYKYYRWGCGRDARLHKLWGDRHQSVTGVPTVEFP